MIDIQAYRLRVGLFQACIGGKSRSRSKIDLLCVLFINLLLKIGVKGVTVIIAFLNTQYAVGFSRGSDTMVYPCSYLGPHYCERNAFFTTPLRSVVLDLFKQDGISVTGIGDLLLYLSGDIEKNPGPTAHASCGQAGSSSLKIFHLNIQSLKPKIDILQCESSAYDIIAFSETWLKPSDPNNEIQLIGFHEPVRKDRPTRGGGVAIYIKDELSFRLRPDFEIPTLECLWVEIFSSKQPLLLGVFYRPPNSDGRCWDLIKASIEKVKDTRAPNIVVVGDFNDNQLVPNSTFLDIANYFGLQQIVREPTHFTEHSASLIDLLAVSNTVNVKTCEVLDAQACLFVNVSPAESNVQETISTLQFGANAKQVALGQAKQNVSKKK